MLPFYIDITTDSDFGVDQFQMYSSNNNIHPVKGILSYNGGNAIIDPKIFVGKSFFKPVEEILKNNIRIYDLTQESFIKLMSQFCEFSVEERHLTNLIFNGDNPFDLEYAFLDNSSGNRLGRLCFHFINCPITSLYLIDDGNIVKIILSVFTKTYFTITESEWLDFFKYQDLSVSESRDIKLNDLLGTASSYVNLIRQLRFVIHVGKNKSNPFLSSVYNQYREKGFISDKQASSVAKIIWD